ncbi:hypothetical protein ACHAW6_011799 [Cyclotella cf. meneghiniana]
MLWWQQIRVYTDRKNLIQHALSSDQVYRWRLLLEYDPRILHIKGIHKIVDDTIS